MRFINGFGVAVALAVFPVESAVAGAQQRAKFFRAANEDALGRKGAMQPGNIIKFSFARSGLVISARGAQLKPVLALESWVAFKPVTKGQAMIMGDLVLLEDKVVTARHSHLLNESARLFFMHFWASDDATKLARKLGWHRTKRTRKSKIVTGVCSGVSSRSTAGRGASQRVAQPLRPIVQLIARIVARESRILVIGAFGSL